MKIVYVMFAVLLVGCAGHPSKSDFPDAPPAQFETLPPLKTIVPAK